jgi:outer membrane receptor protein involved in Fe transport
VKRERNQINDAVRDIETSKLLNDNRSVFRSELLLDQDRAVRSANLAGVYRDAGLTEFSAVEAARAVNWDYGNYSAHLLLANSYDALRDPRLANLRYESPWLNELLLANLLAPVGAGSLSQRVSEQEYSRLFERDHFGISSSTTWLSSGDWRQDISQYGTQGSLSYALDGQHWTQNGSRRNEDFGFESFSAKVKLQVTPQDSLFLQSIYFDNAAGDIAQYYDPAMARANLRTREAQEPVLLAGYHHEWSPGVHTLFLAGRLEDTMRVSDPGQRALLVGRDFGGTVDALAPVSLNLRYRSKLEIYTAEAQQIWQRERHSLILGVRGQSGEFDTRSRQTDPTAFTVFFPSPAAQQGVDSDFQRAAIYAYENVQLTGRLLLSVGVSYDHLEFPENHRTSPVSDRERRLDQISPKAGLTWLISSNTTLRAAYTRSLGGVSLDQSYRLEPVQVAGFTQSYRSGASESLVGSLAGAEFDTYGLALDQHFATGTYVTLAAEILDSDAEQTRGAFFFNAVPPIVPGTLEEELEYQEKAVSLSLNQLLGKEWTLGMRYRWSEADLERRFPLVPLAVSPAADSEMDAALHQLQIYAIFNHGSGFFGRTEAAWHAQSIGGFGQSGDELWQFNAFVGYRFPRRRAELMAGLLNITDEDYRLNPLTIHSELPRERLLALSFKFNFE